MLFISTAAPRVVFAVKIAGIWLVSKICLADRALALEAGGPGLGPSAVWYFVVRTSNSVWYLFSGVAPCSTLWCGVVLTTNP